MFFHKSMLSILFVKVKSHIICSIQSPQDAFEGKQQNGLQKDYGTIAFFFVFFITDVLEIFRTEAQFFGGKITPWCEPLLQGV